jgi:hypothetical protein
VTEETVYNQLCESYRSIEEFRSHLLGLLPFAAGTGLLLAAKEGPALLISLARPLAAFGLLITLGLFSFELYGIRKCAELIRTGKKLEFAQRLQGQFVSRPHGIFNVVNEPFASGVVYSAVLASWTMLWFVRVSQVNNQLEIQRLSPIAWAIAGAVFVSGFFLTVAWDTYLKRSHRTACDGCGRLFGTGENVPTRVTTLRTSPDYWLCLDCSEALGLWLSNRRNSG